MTGDEHENPPTDDRTIFIPATGIALPAATADEVPGNAAPVPPPPAPAPVATAAPAPSPMPTLAPMAMSPTGELRRIQTGDVLNHIFEVRRFIARGGMGEVFEGINVNSEERVAIKVILPHLAADPAVQAMFRKEARTLTRLGHPALVQYRVLAQEPVLGVFYIVTEYVDGQNLSDILKDIGAGPAELTMLTRRLAQGLAAAHALGAIHRDISPDNVMLEGGRLDHAKIIDFGIAKDLDASTGTIVGDGFAGKLNYVAPEQLGDFDRSVGPWTDVYSLGLTILAVARGRDVDMGATLVDAVDKRRAGPDLSPIPEALRPVLEKMLRPNPADRARSMEDVLEMLAAVPAVGTVGAAAIPAKSTEPAKPPKPAGGIGAKGLPSQIAARLQGRIPLIAGLGVGTLAVLGLVWFAVIHLGSRSAAPASGPQLQAAGPIAPPTDLVASARAALEAGLPSVPCTWLDISNIDVNGGNLSVNFRGVAGKPAQAEAIIGKLLGARGIQAASLDFSDVSPIAPGECGPLDAFHQIRAGGVEHLSVAQRSFQMVKLDASAGADAGKMGAQAIIDVDTNGIGEEVALVALEPSGAMTLLTADKKDLAGLEGPRPGTYRIPLNTTHTGSSGILMLTGKGPFEAALLSGPPGSRGADWPEKFLTSARQLGWRSEMVWYRTVDATTH